MEEISKEILAELIKIRELLEPRTVSIEIDGKEIVKNVTQKANLESQRQGLSVR